MISLRSILTLSILLLTSNGAQLVASQMQQQPSLFYERQTNPAVLSGTSAQPGTSQTQAATTPTAAQSSSSQTPYTGGSSSSASASCANAIGSGKNMSEEEEKKIIAFQAQHEALEKEASMKMSDEIYAQQYLKIALSPKQQAVSSAIHEAIIGFPKELARLISLYAFYEFNGICSATITDNSVWMLLPNIDGSLISWARKMPREKDSFKLWVPTADAKGITSWRCAKTLSNLIIYPNGVLLTIPDNKVPSDCGSLMDCSGTYVGEKRIAMLRNGNLACGHHDGSIVISSPISNSKGEDREKTKTTLKGHTDFVDAVVAWPDGSLASGSDDKTIKIWSPVIGTDEKITSWKCTQTLKGHAAGVKALAILPNGDLASASCDKSIRIWTPVIDANRNISWRCSKILTDYTNEVKLLTVLQNGTLASASWDGTIKIWE